MPMYKETLVATETLSDGRSVERFLTDEDQSNVTDNVVRRMMSPSDCMTRLNMIAERRQDLHVKSHVGLNMRYSPKNDSLFCINPVGQGGLCDYVKDHGPIYMSERAVNQLSSLMGVKRGYSRYEGMGEIGASHFIADFASFWNNRGSSQEGLIFRTRMRGTEREVEGVMPDNIDRTDSSIMVAGAMGSIMARYGNCIRGVEVFESWSQGGAEFRILFGNPVFREQEAIQTKRLYTMLSLSVSDTRVFSPRASIGIWRMHCSNGAMSQQFEQTSFKMSPSDSFHDFKKGLNDMADIAFPFAGFISVHLQNSQVRKLNSSIPDTLNMLRDNGGLGDEIHSRCIDFHKEAHMEHNVSTDWGIFNLITDAAKVCGSMSARRNAEDKALSYIMYPGGINSVAQDGFNRVVFNRYMKEAFKNQILSMSQLAIPKMSNN